MDTPVRIPQAQVRALRARSPGQGSDVSVRWNSKFLLRRWGSLDMNASAKPPRRAASSRRRSKRETSRDQGKRARRCLTESPRPGRARRAAGRGQGRRPGGRGRPRRAACPGHCLRKARSLPSPPEDHIHVRRRRRPCRFPVPAQTRSLPARERITSFPPSATITSRPRVPRSWSRPAVPTIVAR